MLEPIVAWNVVVTFTEPILGTVPKNRDLYSKYIESEKVKRVSHSKGEEVVEETESVPEVDESRGWTGFHTDEKGLHLLDYGIKGALKEAGNILKDALGIKALRSKIDNYVFVFPRRVYFEDQYGNTLQEPDGVFERPLRAQTPQGPRVSLVKSDQINAGRRLRFRIEVVDGCPIKRIEHVIEQCLSYWSLKGLGQFRNGSFGRVTFEKTLIEKKEVGKPK
jgi:hypothetical protein